MTTGKVIVLTIWIFVGKVTCLLFFFFFLPYLFFFFFFIFKLYITVLVFNTLSRFTTAFLPKSKHFSQMGSTQGF